MHFISLAAIKSRKNKKREDLNVAKEKNLHTSDMPVRACFGNGCFNDLLDLVG